MQSRFVKVERKGGDRKRGCQPGRKTRKGHRKMIPVPYACGRHTMSQRAYLVGGDGKIQMLHFYAGIIEVLKLRFF